MTPVDDTRCDLGEGPLWHPERGQLFWFDITAGRLHSPGKVWQFDRMVSAAGWVDPDRLMIASETGVFVFDLATGQQTPVCDLEADNRVTRSNDGRADPQGGFWIGTMGKGAEPGAGAIWRWYRGELRRLFAPITISNAICFAPDGRSACFTDTPTRRVMRVALDSDGWPLGDPQVFLDLSNTALNPDGAVIDAAGVLWLAQWGAARVAAYGPDGAYLREVAFAARHTSCPAFGGPDLRDLYCTSARQGLDAPGPLDGATFCAPNIAQGQREHRILWKDPT
jgi:sugar lactone lactonase YvrE